MKPTQFRRAAFVLSSEVLCELALNRIRSGSSNRRELALRPIAFGVAAMYAEPEPNRI